VSLSRVSPRFLQWFGVLGAAFSWAVFHVVGFALTQASCERAGLRWSIATDGLTTAATVVAAVIAVLAGVAAVATYRGARDASHDDPPPKGREQFLGVVGMAVTPLFLFIIVMDGSGVLAGSVCHQS
jgi:heme/copper-type cytochrome/quinol oxidase subunit 2